MEIYTISQYGNFQYKEILEEFWRFKQVILNYLTNFEDIIQEVINSHVNFTSIFPEVYNFIEKEFSIKDFVNSIQNKYTISNNHLLYKGIKNDTNQLKIELQKIYTQIQMIFQQQLLNQQLLPSRMINLNDQSHHEEIEIINENEIRRSKLSNGRWLIQTLRIQKEKNYCFRSKNLVFTINGSDTVFGVASYSQVVKHNFEMQYPIPSAYFVRQDGVHFGFGLTEVQQDFSVPGFSSKKGHQVSMGLQTGQNILILENLVTKEKEEYVIPELSDDWCYIFGFRFHNDSIILEQ
ncbi:unnamed protein product (macronuclear) [Paramecium tetraurelia]|uniref:TLDc domain-containing protein n=1 Tax=Paramecium tetraurelia TaxID=5888 RepID=A0EC30_PARTE|nr:uncharacterized protein GSPATT00025583001 [Paramecium tetraurelia]CAK92847.1 unnamed protein product [Paramecium tetraurelia]|eukprot:XP_001460244.1 hypothetical protein (macronuclear) [Paramecium tetraurelia strain d4-2]